MEIQLLYTLANKQIERNKWIRAMIAHHQAKIQIYKLMVGEWEDEIKSLDAEAKSKVNP